MSQFPEMGQPGSSAPFSTMPGTPPPRKSRWWLWLLLGVGGMGVVICCGCAGLVWFGWSAASGVIEARMVENLNKDVVAKEQLGEVSSAKMDLMAMGEATQKANSGKSVLVFKVDGEKSVGVVHADQAAGEKMFENARLIMPGGEEFPLGF